MCWPTRTTSRNVGKRLPAPSCVGPEPTTADLGMGRRRGRGPGRCTAPRTAAVFPPRLSPLRSSRCPEERYAQSPWPESHPVSGQKLTDTGRAGQVHRSDTRAPTLARTTKPRRSPYDRVAEWRPPTRAHRTWRGAVRRHQVRTPSLRRDLGAVSARGGPAPRAPPRGGPSAAGAWRPPRRTRHPRRARRRCARGGRQPSRSGGRIR